MNLFQNTPVRSDGGIGVERSPSQPGAYVEFRAELDLFFVVTACSMDVVDINGGKSTPLRIDVFESQRPLLLANGAGEVGVARREVRSG